MPIVAKKGEDRKPVDAGVYQAVCTAVIDLGTQQPRNPKYRARQEVLFIWELCDERVEYEKDGEKHSFMRTVRATYPLYFGGSKPSKLRSMLESWRSRPFTAEELDGFDLKNVLGVNCLITVVHNVTPTGTYANVGSVSPLMKGSAKRNPEAHPLYFTLSDIADGAALVWPPTMPEWVRGEIMKSAEYLVRFDGVAGNDNGHDQHDGDPGIQDDDIPF